MDNSPLAAALDRARSVLTRRPDMGLHDDAPAVATVEAGTRVRARHANGIEVISDMPPELGGLGGQVTPGWLYRAGLASCAATCVSMVAATEGIALEHVEVEACSRSDTRGVLGMRDESGAPICPASRDLLLRVRVRAPGVPGERVRALVESALHCSPIPASVRKGEGFELQIDVDPA